MSTPEGERLMKCNCSGDASCEASKSNISPCKDEVMYATQKDTVVSCTAAQWICASDMECSTALNWYNNLCQGMFKGKECNDRCMNSIKILQRQKPANKLENCYCQGTEDFDCQTIKNNMQDLCFDKPKENDLNSNEIDLDGPQKKKANSGNGFEMHSFLLTLSVLLSLVFNDLI